MADRTVFQAGQTTLAATRLLWPLGKGGALPNRVRDQCLLAGGILKKQLGLNKTLSEILQICGVNIFEQAPARELLTTEPNEKTVSQDRVDFQKCFELNDL